MGRDVQRDERQQRDEGEAQPPANDAVANDERDRERRRGQRQGRDQRRAQTMPFRKSAISAAVSVTGTSMLLDPPLASRSGLTPRDPAEATV